MTLHDLCWRHKGLPLATWYSYRLFEQLKNARQPEGIIKKTQADDDHISLMDYTVPTDNNG